MEPEGYVLLKIETKIDMLEKEISIRFKDFKKYEIDVQHLSENITYNKLQEMNACCLKLLETYREYTKS